MDESGVNNASGSAGTADGSGGARGGAGKARSVSRSPLARARRIVIVLFVLYAVYLLVAVAMQETFYFPRYMVGPVDEAARPPARVESIWIEPEPGVRVEAWLGIPASEDGERARALVVFTHGNGEVIDHNASLMDHYLRHGVAVLMPEYRDYGRSTGRPSQAAITQDVLRFIDLALEREALSGVPVVYHGRSIGGGIAGSVGAERPPDGMIIESSFTSLRSMMGRYLVPRWIARNHMDTGALIRTLDVPMLFVHGDADGVIPVSHAHANAAAAIDGELVIIAGAGHNDIFVEDPVVWAAIERLLERVRERRERDANADGERAASGE
ncbi:MAG: alpha/beta hydrolase [Phycisphaerales bacterium]